MQSVGIKANQPSDLVNYVAEANRDEHCFGYKENGQNYLWGKLGKMRVNTAVVKSV